MRAKRPDDLVGLAVDDRDEIGVARVEDQVFWREALIALVEPMVRPDRLQVVDMKIIRVFRSLEKLELFRREADLVNVIGGRPGPDDLAFRIDLIGEVVEDLRRREAGEGINDIGENQRVAVRKASDVVVLLSAAAGRRAAEAPDRLAVPVDLANRLVGARLDAPRDEVGSL